jgi:hypothetical protein
MTRQVAHVISVVAAVALVLAGLYCVLWIYSSASLACMACNCSYSLFAASFRCRQPYIAMILAAVLFALALVAARFGRNRSNAVSPGDSPGGSAKNDA